MAADRIVLLCMFLEFRWESPSQKGPRHSPSAVDVLSCPSWERGDRAHTLGGDHCGHETWQISCFSECFVRETYPDDSPGIVWAVGKKRTRHIGLIQRGFWTCGGGKDPETFTGNKINPGPQVSCILTSFLLITWLGPRCCSPILWRGFRTPDAFFGS